MFPTSELRERKYLRVGFEITKDSGDYLEALTASYGADSLYSEM